MRGKNKRKEKKWENVMAEMGGEREKLGIQGFLFGMNSGD